MRLPSHLAKLCAVSERPLLSALTTSGVGGVAAKGLVAPEDRIALGTLIAFFHGASISWRVIGAGSNILAPDSDIDMVLVSLRPMNQISHRRDSSLRLTVGAGASLPRLVSFCCDAGLSGAECLAGIPGTVGGAVKMNAGGRHGDVGRLLEEVHLIDGKGGVQSKKAAECGLVYRGSALEGLTVTEVTLRLSRSTPLRVRQATEKVMEEKKHTQPLSDRSCGCVFKNPPGRHAGKLLDEADLKGTRCGGARFSPKHAAFIINEGGATRRDYDTLIDMARTRVQERFGIDLDLEIERW